MSHYTVPLVITRRQVVEAIADHTRYVCALQRRLSPARDDERDRWLAVVDDETAGTYQILCEAMAMRMRRYLDIACTEGADVASQRLERLRSLA